MNLSGQTLIIRADVNSQIGLGHVMRCLALAQGWQDEGGRVILVMGKEAASTSERWKSEGMEVRVVLAELGSNEDAAKTAKLAKENNASCIVVDGYHFNADYQRVIKDSGQKLLFVDDYGHADHYYADIVLNQNIYANEQLYSKRESYTRLLLGSDYVFLRREFLKWREYKREIPEIAKKILVTMGGSDPKNCTLKVLEALFLLQLKEIEVTVVAGGENPHYETLQSKVSDAPFSIRLERNVKNMPELMAWADVAISAGGSTAWELAFMGLPSLMIIIAENQRRIVEGLELHNGTVNLGFKNEFKTDLISNRIEELCKDKSRRIELSDINSFLVDGKGIKRLLSIISCLDSEQLQSEYIKIRKAVLGDAYQIWKLANDPTVRKNAFNKEPIALKDHIRWFKEKLSSPDCLIKVLEYKSVLSALIRYDRINEDYIEIDFAVIDSLRGKGLGTKILISTMAIAVQELDLNCLRGTVLKSNKPSYKSFINAGFRKMAENSELGNDYCVFEWKL